jgi:hypothetical protein
MLLDELQRFSDLNVAVCRRALFSRDTVICACLSERFMTALSSIHDRISHVASDGGATACQRTMMFASLERDARERSCSSNESVSSSS